MLSCYYQSGRSHPQHSRKQCNSPPPQLLLPVRSIPHTTQQNTMQISTATVAASRSVDPTLNTAEHNETLHRHSCCFPFGRSHSQHSRTQCNYPPPQLLLPVRSITTSTQENKLQLSTATFAASRPVDHNLNTGEHNATLHRHSCYFPSGRSQPQHSRKQSNSPPPQLLLPVRSIPPSTQQNTMQLSTAIVAVSRPVDPTLNTAENNATLHSQS